MKQAWLLALLAICASTEPGKPDEAQHFLLLAAESSLTSKLQKQAQVAAEAPELLQALGALDKLQLLWQELEKTESKLAPAEHAALLQSQGRLASAAIPEVALQQLQSKARNVEDAAEKLLKAQAKESEAWLYLSVTARSQTSAAEQVEQKENHDLQSRFLTGGKYGCGRYGNTSCCNSTAAAFKALRKAKVQAKRARASSDSLQRLSTTVHKRTTSAWEDSSQADRALKATKALQALAKESAKEEDEKMEAAMTELNKRNKELQDHLAQQESKDNSSWEKASKNESNSSKSAGSPQHASNSSSEAFPPQSITNTSTGALPPQSKTNTSTGALPPQNITNTSTSASAPQNITNTSTSAFPPQNITKSSTSAFQPQNISANTSMNTVRPWNASNTSTGASPPQNAKNSSSVFAPQNAGNASTALKAPTPAPMSSQQLDTPKPGQPLGMPANGQKIPPTAPQKPTLAELRKREGKQTGNDGELASEILLRARELLTDSAAVSRRAREIEDCQQKGKPCSNLEVSEVITPAPISSTVSPSSTQPSTTQSSTTHSSTTQASTSHTSTTQARTSHTSTTQASTTQASTTHPITKGQNWIPHKAGQVPSPPPAPKQPSAFGGSSSTTTTSSATTRDPTALQPVVLPPTPPTSEEIADEYPSRQRIHEVGNKQKTPTEDEDSEDTQASITQSTSTAALTSASVTESTSSASQNTTLSTTSTAPITSTSSASVQSEAEKIRKDIDEAADGQVPSPHGVPADEEEDAAAARENEGKEEPNSTSSKPGSPESEGPPGAIPSEDEEDNDDEDSEGPPPCADQADDSSPCGGIAKETAKADEESGDGGKVPTPGDIENTDSDEDLPMTDKDPWLAAVHEQARLVSLLARRSKAAQVRFEGLSAAVTAAAEVASKLQSAAKDQKEALDVINASLQASEGRCKSLNASVTLARAAYNKLQLECQALEGHSSTNNSLKSSEAQGALQQARLSVEEAVRLSDERRTKLKAVVLNLTNFTESLHVPSPHAPVVMQQDSKEQGPRTILPRLEDRNEAMFCKPLSIWLLMLVGLLK